MRGLSIKGSPARVVAWLDGQWITVLGVDPAPAEPAPTDPIGELRPDAVEPRHTPEPPTGPMLNVGTLASQSLARAKVSDSGTVVSATKHVLSVDVTEIRLDFVVSAGWFTADSAATLTVSVEGAGMERKPLTWGGAATLDVAAPTATAVTYTSDPLPVSWIAGDRITVRVEATAPPGALVPGDATGITSIDPAEAQASIRPARIVAPSNRSAWVVIGDSIAQQPYSYGEQGLARRGLPSVKSAIGGDGYIYWPGRYDARVAPHQDYATHLLDTMGMNDTDAARALRLWKYVRDSSQMAIIKTTINPDHKFRTIAEAEAATGSREPKLRDFNEWLRDGAPVSADWLTPYETGSTATDAVRCTVVNYDGDAAAQRDEGHPLQAVIDPAAAIVKSRENPVYSDEALAIIGAGDSLHPAQGVHALMAKRIANDLQLLGY